MMQRRRWQALRGRPLQTTPTDAIQRVLRKTLTFQQQGEDDIFQVKDQKKRTYIVHIDRKHSCSCPSTQRPCDHIIFILLKYYRMPPDSHSIHKQGLSVYELDSLKRAIKNRTTNVPKVEENTECAVCCEILKVADRCVWCRKCGNSLHQKCMQSWAEHQLLQDNASEITCIFCRAPFELLDVYEDFKLPQLNSLQQNTTGTPPRSRSQRRRSTHSRRRNRSRSGQRRRSSRVEPPQEDERISSIQQGLMRQSQHLEHIQSRIQEASSTTARLSSMIQDQENHINHLRGQMRHTNDRLEELAQQQTSWNELSSHQRSVAQFINQIRSDMENRHQSITRLRHSPVLHVHHTCYTCAMSPIRGILYKCTLCHVELCQECHTSHPHQQFKCRKHAFGNPSLGWVDTTSATLRGTNRLQSLIQQSQVDRESLANRLSEAMANMNELHQSMEEHSIPSIPQQEESPPRRIPSRGTPSRRSPSSISPIRRTRRSVTQFSPIHDPLEHDSPLLLLTGSPPPSQNVPSSLLAMQYRDITPDDYAVLNDLPNVKVESKNKSLLIGHLTKLSINTYRDPTKECPICLEHLIRDVVPLSCSHVYHRSCILKWVQQDKETCPVCTAPIFKTKSLKKFKRIKKKIKRPKKIKRQL
mmetsp:Transcript_11164/g.16490  ORF Transcript_11164/g.16490 Transcript_11164/m.16490 type:complete len:642 (-) Transcript_11164:8-1933(-)